MNVNVKYNLKYKYYCNLKLFIMILKSSQKSPITWEEGF